MTRSPPGPEAIATKSGIKTGGDVSVLSTSSFHPGPRGSTPNNVRSISGASSVSPLKQRSNGLSIGSEYTVPAGREKSHPIIGDRLVRLTFLTK